MKSNLKRILTSLIVALALVAILYALSSSTLPTHSDPAPALSEPMASPGPRTERQALQRAPRAEPAPPATEPAETEHPHSAANVHASLAAHLQRVAVSCPLPDSIEDGPAFGEEILWIDDQRVFSAVVDELEGSKLISIMDRNNPLALIVPSFHVRWAAQAWGEQVRCHIEPVEFGTIELTIKTDDGEPMHGNLARVCGEKGVLDEGRLVLSRAVAMPQCHLVVLPSEDRLECSVSRLIPGPTPGGTVQMELIAPCDLSENSFRHPVNAPPKEPPPESPSLSEQLAEAERLREELPDDSEGALVLDRRIREIEASLEFREIYSILDEPDLSPEDREAVMDEVFDFMLEVQED
ncbi:MAG: hypothetical protein EA397_19665 [Deltaproteobacteria bacterium]|nr:MAG: hypothetical protein EA397_19665 [Deltaproteobacteria bacterium]